MFKKTIVTIIVICLAAVLAATFVSCDGAEETVIPANTEETEYEIPASMVAENYPDYASSVYLNTEQYPLLADQGLFLVTGFDNGYSGVNEVAADDENGIRDYFDPSKSSIIFIHGVALGGGRHGSGHTGTENRKAEIATLGNGVPTDGYTDYLEEIDYSKYWKDKGYNVFYFHYERFADLLGYNEDDLFSLASSGLDSVKAVLGNIWSRENVKAVYVENGTVKETDSNDAFTANFSVAEFYAAEYIRTMKLVDEIYPSYKTSGYETWTAAHSMGGVVNVASNYLIKQVSDQGQIPSALTVDRFFQMDSYVGIGGGTIAWTGESYLDGNVGVCYTAALEALVKKYGVQVTFYANEYFSVPFMLAMAQWDEEKSVFDGDLMGDIANRILEVTTMVLIRPYFAGVADPVYINGHNAIREWVLSSILYDAPAVTDENQTSYTIPTAKISTADAKKTTGRFFAMETKNMPGSETVRCDDDAFVIWK